jgi:membrane protease YdiL (CAAX protease family)
MGSSKIYHYQNTSHAVQIFMEDVTIALVFVRLSAWIGRKWSIIIVAILFAGGHIPTMISNGAELLELGTLFIDAFLGVLVLLAISKSKDIWWFFMVHFAMDMTQFYGS